jgi:rare lipoprotein A (peptidoglycan hydrolase)
MKIDGSEQKVLTQAKSIRDIFPMENIRLDEDDIVKPDRSESVTEGLNIVVTRVEIREEVNESAIPFETKVTEDSVLSWRKKITTQKGEKGVKATTYRVAYHDGKEVSRKVLKMEITKDPTTELVTQGTFVKLGKKHEGGASWYAYTGTMAAANPWLPKGSYVKVTNLENGKSVIVVINDRGPFVGGRIIDLDKVAFQKIASLGAGVINVKMEEIVN